MHKNCVRKLIKIKNNKRLIKINDYIFGSMYLKKIASNFNIKHNNLLS